MFYCVQVYSNNSEVASLHPNQTRFTLTQLTAGTPYLISVGAFTDAGEGEREEQMIKADSPTEAPSGIYSTHHLRFCLCTMPYVISNTLSCMSGLHSQ